MYLTMHLIKILLFLTFSASATMEKLSASNCNVENIKDSANFASYVNQQRIVLKYQNISVTWEVIKCIQSVYLVKFGQIQFQLAILTKFAMTYVSLFL